LRATKTRQTQEVIGSYSFETRPFGNNEIDACSIQNGGDGSDTWRGQM